MNRSARKVSTFNWPTVIDGRAYLLYALTSALVSCIINLPGVNRSEVIDDHELLHRTQARGCGRNPIDCFRHPQFGLYYRPMMGASFSVGENLHGLDPFAFHVENVVLHGIVVAEAFWVFRLLLRRSRAALLAGTLYALHPLQVSVTTFIGGRTDTLALLFLLFFVISTVKAREQGYRAAWIAISVAAFACAIFCKEQCLPLVVLAPLLAGPLEASDRAVDRRAPWIHPWMLLYGLPIAILLYAAYQVIPSTAIDTVGWVPTRTRVAWDPGLRVEMVGRTLCFFARVYTWPTLRSLHQSSLGAWDIPQPLTALWGFFAGGLGIAVLWQTWPDRRLRILALWAVISIVPCLNVVPIPSQFVACYRAVIPLLGIAGLLGAAFDRLLTGRRGMARFILGRALPIAAAASLAILSSVDVPVWRSDTVLTRVQIYADSNFLPALAGLATSLRKEGRRREALEVNDRVVRRIFPSQTTLAERVAIIDSPWMLRSIKSQSSLRYQPRAVVDYVMRERGGGAQDLGLYDRAVDDYRLALAVVPADDEVAEALITCCERSGRFDDAMDALQRLILRAPTAARLQRLGLICVRVGRWAEAKVAFGRARALAAQEGSGNVEAIVRKYDEAVTTALRDQQRRRSELALALRPAKPRRQDSNSKRPAAPIPSAAHIVTTP